MSYITLEEFAMLVECPACGACEVGGDDVEGCWDIEGRAREPIHPERLGAAWSYLNRAREAVTESRS